MAEKKRRGRPKGSGIDDQRRLKDIARLMVAEPELKPTTAIRTLGHTNPSIIRRLRDKLNRDLDTLLAEARRDLGIRAPERPALPRRPAPPPVRRDALLELAHAPRVCAEALPAGIDPVRRRALETETGNGVAHQPASSSASAKKFPPLRPAESGEVLPATRPDEATLVEIGFRAAAAAMRQHLNICAQVAHIPAVAAFIRQQMFLTEIMLGVGLPSHRPPSSRH